ncbi:hypothetical protein [Streptomyces sp. NPDC054765]
MDAGRTIKSLAAAVPALSLPWPAEDPWPGQSARQVAEVSGKTKLSTPVVPPGTWFPLIRAAWAYIHDFAPDIMRADRRHEELLAAANPMSSGLDARLEEWLADPQDKVPIHTVPSCDLVPHVNWSLLTLLLGYNAVHRSAFSDSLSNTAKARLRRRALVLEVVAARRITSHALVGDLAQVIRPDGSTGPWHHGIDPRGLRDLKLALRDAAFVLVVGLSMMRDSEIQEILRAPVVEHYSTLPSPPRRSRAPPAAPASTGGSLNPSSRHLRSPRPSPPTMNASLPLSDRAQASTAPSTASSC